MANNNWVIVLTWEKILFDIDQQPSILTLTAVPVIYKFLTMAACKLVFRRNEFQLCYQQTPCFTEVLSSISASNDFLIALISDSAYWEANKTLIFTHAVYLHPLRQLCPTIFFSHCYDWSSEGFSDWGLGIQYQSRKKKKSAETSNDWFHMKIRRYAEVQVLISFGLVFICSFHFSSIHCS